MPDQSNIILAKYELKIGFFLLKQILNRFFFLTTKIFRLQNIQNDFRIAVTDITSDFVRASPIDPNAKPENNRARYGRLANIPA